MPIPSVTAEIAQAHEVLFGRLTRLLGLVESVARRRPGEGVTPDLARLALELLYEARRFGVGGLRASGRIGGKGRGARQQPPEVRAPTDYAGLAAQLGQALAGLEAFEARHTAWDAPLGAFVWRLGRRGRAPVARLRPRLLTQSPRETARSHENRNKFNHMLAVRDQTMFEKGFAQGRDGTAAEPSAAAGYPPLEGWDRPVSRG
jgi:hypothetical protein